MFIKRNGAEGGGGMSAQQAKHGILPLNSSMQTNIIFQGKFVRCVKFSVCKKEQKMT